MRVLITGGGGLLGGTLISTAPGGVEVHATQRRAPVSGAEAHRVDLADAPAVAALLERLRPHAVIHAAYGHDDPERDIVAASRAVAEGCARSGAALVHVSTDLVLDGEHAPYDESAEAAPIDEHGRWKAAAERAVLAAAPYAAVARTSLIIRADPPNLSTARIVESLRAGEASRLYVDELRCPIFVEDLARQLWEIAALPAERRVGVWNLAGPEAVSRFTLGILIARRFGLDASLLLPALNATHPAPRPRDLRLLTPRADRELTTRPRTITAALLPG
ncbi:MAG TPA: sugar nucleotide-binding protein [Longimicrobium sp.]|nr:sugar nucleotide-binding protein [Longimicrobium sp.]